MGYRVIDFFACEDPPRPAPDLQVVNQMSQLFKAAMLAQEDSFRTQAIAVGKSQPLFAFFMRVKETAGFVVWTRYQSQSMEDFLQRGFSAVTVLLSDISAEADEQAIEILAANAHFDERMVKKLRQEQRPVAITFYLDAPLIIETASASATVALAVTFFSLLGAEQE